MGIFAAFAFGVGVGIVFRRLACWRKEWMTTFPTIGPWEITTQRHAEYQSDEYFEILRSEGWWQVAHIEKIQPDGPTLALLIKREKCNKYFGGTWKREK